MATKPLPRLWTEHERRLFAASLTALSDSGVEKISTPAFPEDLNLNVMFLIWQAGREEMKERCLEIATEAQDDLVVDEIQDIL